MLSDKIVVSESKAYLENLLEPINIFLREQLGLNLHPEKVQILKYIRGIDFLGHVIFPHHRLIRKKTWKRMVRKLKEKIKIHKECLISKESLDQTVQSYLGILFYTNSYKLSCDLQNQYWFWLNQ